MARGMKLAIVTIAFVGLFGVMIPSFAAVTVPCGIYFEGDGGYSAVHDFDTPAGATGNAAGYGWNISLGDKFNPFFGAELGYTSYATTKTRNAAGSLAAKALNYSYHVAVKGMLPFGKSGFQLFAKLGPNQAIANETIYDPAVASTLNIDSGKHSAINVYYAVGAEYSFLCNLAANLQWSRAYGNSATGNFDLYALGFTFYVN